MTTTCSACQGTVLPDALFCHRCGHRLREAAPAPAGPAEADRRQVTVLFADLTGFTSLAERLDPEVVRAFQNALFATMAECIERRDGFVEKYVGDAVMAVFGAPRAHEDDPARAIEAALEVLQRVERLGETWRTRLGRGVTLHVGVHTGAVVAGTVGSGAALAYAVTGDTVNTAARLLSAAEPGSVLVSEATQRLVRHRFEFDPATEVSMRGKSQPLRVHRLAGARAEATEPRGLAELGLAAALVGRDAAIAELHAAYRLMRSGSAQLVSVIGQAGIGKSRLVAEFLGTLETSGGVDHVALRRTRCNPFGEPPYGVFGALFRDAYRVDADEPLDSARGKLHDGLRALGAEASECDAIARVLHHLLGIGDRQPQQLDPEQLKRQITLAARAMLELRLAQEPLLIVIDDLHWADAASVELIRELIDSLAQRPLLLVVSQRPESPRLTPRIAGQRIIELGPLGDAQTAELLDRLLGVDTGDARAPLRDWVLARAGGNPLFVEELVRSLVGRGLLVREHGRWVCSSTCDAVDVPPTLYGLLLSRVDRLRADDRRVLQEAAVLGAEFDAALLKRLLGEPADPALRRLAESELIRPDSPDGSRWRFTHALLHEVVYQNLLLASRSALHERAGRALEEQLGCTGSGPGDAPRRTLRLADLAALGHHWSCSPDKLRGAQYLMAAADRARAVFANADAMRHLERVLQALAEAGDEGSLALELDARERLAELLGRTGRRAEALEQYTIVGRAAGAADRVRSARIQRKVGALHWEAGERDRARACFESGLELLGADGDAVERAHLLQEMGRLAFRAGDAAAALALAHRALAELPPGSDADTERERDRAAVRAQACNTLGVALARLGRLPEAVEQIERSVRDAEANDLPQAACRGYTNLGVLYASLDPQRSIATCQRGLEAARKVGDLGFQSHLYANLAVAYCALTERCDAEGLEAAHAAANLDRRLGMLDHLAVPLIVLAQIHQCHGDHTRALAMYEEALALAERIGEPQLLFPCYDGLATLHLDAGRHAQAEAFLERADSVCQAAGVAPDELMVLPFLC